MSDNNVDKKVDSFELSLKTFNGPISSLQVGNLLNLVEFDPAVRILKETYDPVFILLVNREDSLVCQIDGSFVEHVDVLAQVFARVAQEVGVELEEPKVHLTEYVLTKQEREIPLSVASPRKVISPKP